MSVEKDIEAITARDPELGRVLSHLHGKKAKDKIPSDPNEGVRPNVAGTKRLD